MSRNRHYDVLDNDFADDGYSRFGFLYGAARVTRVASDVRGLHVLALDTPFHHVQIAVSRTGRNVRVWLDHHELSVVLPDPVPDPVEGDGG